MELAMDTGHKCELWSQNISPKGSEWRFPFILPLHPYPAPKVALFIVHQLFPFQTHSNRFLPLTEPSCGQYPVTCVFHLPKVLCQLQPHKAEKQTHERTKRTTFIMTKQQNTSVSINRGLGKRALTTHGLEYDAAGEQDAGFLTPAGSWRSPQVWTNMLPTLFFFFSEAQ